MNEFARKNFDLFRQKIDEFDRLHRHHEHTQLNETQTRVEYIDVMFRALGWDMSNEGNLPQSQREVIHEDRVPIRGGHSRAPDYSFRIGKRRRFFVEAKKPSVNLQKHADSALQIRRYGWSANLPLNILTDFEEFIVFDCRTKPKDTDRANRYQFMEPLTYDRYLNEWEQIRELFSREAVLSGSLDKLDKKRQLQSFDEEFLKDLDRWREDLARTLAQNNTLSAIELNEVVQLILDRIVFLRICEDRDIRPVEMDTLTEIAQGKKIYERLQNLFRQADERYNSGLFHFRNERGRDTQPDTFTPALHVADSTLRKIIQQMYPPESPYDFSAVSADILGQVYERFLGKSLTMPTRHRVQVEEKPEVLKANGVYYTPDYIVNHIVERTLGKVLEGKTPEQAAEIRILDPACGSGSFLLGAFQYLIDWHIDYYRRKPSRKYQKRVVRLFRRIAEDETEELDEYALTVAEKKRILVNNLYGVDKDPQAVEVAKLSLLLKVLEGENSESVQDQLRLNLDRALPDLGGNIKCGNSLIGTDYPRYLQDDLLGNDPFRELRPFDWRHPVHGFGPNGFHAVIGNPPYGASLNPAEKKYLEKKYAQQSYQLDSYLLFVEQSISNLLAKDGMFGMIIPNPWITNLKQTAMRRFIFQNSRVEEIVHFGFYVFPATVDTQILILGKSDGDGSVDVYVADDCNAEITPSGCSKHIAHRQSDWAGLEGKPVNIFLSRKGLRLQRKCEKGTIPLSDICKINVGIKPYQSGKGKPKQTKDTVNKRPFDSDRCLDDTYRPIIRGADITRYSISPQESRYIKYGEWLAEPRPSADFDAPKKIVMRQTGDSLIAALDDSQLLCFNNLHVIVPTQDDVNLFFILGVLNSKLLNWYYQTLNPEIGEGLAEVKKTYVAQLPIRLADSKMETEVANLVHDLIEAKKKTENTPSGREQANRRMSMLEAQIDKYIYDLYGITQSEQMQIDSG